MRRRTFLLTALTLHTLPQISKELSKRKPEGWRDKTSSRDIFATTRCSTSPGTSLHFTEEITLDGAWNVVTSFTVFAAIVTVKGRGLRNPACSSSMVMSVLRTSRRLISPRRRVQ